LFIEQNSIYKSLPCDPWDSQRDARNWPGGTPFIAHPPCRLWCRLRTFSTAPADEKILAPMAITWAREYGGIVEHPAGSQLFKFMSLPTGRNRDQFGGWTLHLAQREFGHLANKETYLYIVGIDPRNVMVPLTLKPAERVIETRKSHNRLPRLPKSQRNKTPEAFARWLIELATHILPRPIQ
jgi:hypothetical protein